MKKRKIALVVIFSIIIYFFIPRENIVIVTQMSESEIKGLEKVLKPYSLIHLLILR